MFSMNMEPKELEKTIGYEFKDKSQLKLALTHSSYGNNRKKSANGSNERLEFLGDAVLELIASESLYSDYPDVTEGELTRIRASLVCEQSLAACARTIGLGNYILLGRGEVISGGRERESIVSDAFEALIGAIYLDGGFANAKDFIDRFVLNDIENRQLFYDSKTILQELIQKDFKDRLEYVHVGELGPDHDKTFIVDITFDGKPICQGEGKNKKRAEQDAAFKAIKVLKEMDIIKDDVKNT